MGEPKAGLSAPTAVILAGGLGTRLRSVVPETQKVLATVSGRPFVTFLLDQLVRAEAGEVVLCTGYGAEEVQRVLGDRYGTLRLRYSREEEPLGTGGALRLALPYIDSDPVVVMNGDSFVDLSLAAFWDWYTKRRCTPAMVLARVSDRSRFGRVELAEDGRILRFEEKGETAKSGWINAGVYLLERAFIERIPTGRFHSLERDLFPGLIEKGLYGYRCEGAFVDIGTPESYGLARSCMGNLVGRPERSY